MGSGDRPKNKSRFFEYPLGPSAHRNIAMHDAQIVHGDIGIAANDWDG